MRPAITTGRLALCAPPPPPPALPPAPPLVWVSGRCRRAHRLWFVVPMRRTALTPQDMPGYCSLQCRKNAPAAQRPPAQPPCVACGQPQGALIDGFDLGLCPRCSRLLQSTCRQKDRWASHARAALWCARAPVGNPHPYLCPLCGHVHVGRERDTGNEVFADRAEMVAAIERAAAAVRAHLPPLTLAALLTAWDRVGPQPPPRRSGHGQRARRHGWRTIHSTNPADPPRPGFGQARPAPRAQPVNPDTGEVTRNAEH